MTIIDMEPFSIFTYLTEKFGVLKSLGGPYLDVLTSAFVALLLTLFAFLAWRKIRHTETHLLPDGHVTITNLLEIITEAVLRLMSNIMGPQRARTHLPLIGSLFIFILVSDLLGVVPGFYPPTENINTNLACALVVFVYYNYYGIREQGIKNYFKNMAGPVIWLAPLIFSIEVISHVVRPVSLSVRLMGNMTGDHMVLGIFSDLVPLFLPIVFMGLAIFISVMQAFVFTLLSMVYIQMACTSE
ncbi:MAG: F0F1 ATP synthase subunit A [Pseudomonadota bacterium]